MSYAECAKRCLEYGTRNGQVCHSFEYWDKPNDLKCNIYHRARRFGPNDRFAHFGERRVGVAPSVGGWRGDATFVVVGPTFTREDLAIYAMRDLSEALGRLGPNLGLQVGTADRDPAGYRLAVGPFSTRPDADRYCSSLKQTRPAPRGTAAGGAEPHCFVVEPR